MCKSNYGFCGAKKAIYLYLSFFFQVVLWFTDDLNIKATFEEHSMIITDVRFSSIMTRLATSSFDKTIRVWDANNVIHLCQLPSYSNVTLMCSNVLTILLS